MEKRGIRILITISIIVFIIAFFHTLTTVVLGPNSIRAGITGQISFAPNTLADNLASLSQPSRIILAIEWLAVIVVVLIILIKGTMKLSKDREKEQGLETEITLTHKKLSSETDLDTLYKILKEKKVLRTEVVSKLFKVDKEITKEWFKILEEADLAEIRYPTIGSPKIVLIEKQKEDEKEED